MMSLVVPYWLVSSSPNTSIWAQTCIGNMMVGFLFMKNESGKLEFVMLVMFGQGVVYVIVEMVSITKTICEYVYILCVLDIQK